MTQAQQKFYSVEEWSKLGGKLDTTDWSEQAKTYYLCASYSRSALYALLLDFDKALGYENSSSESLIKLKHKGQRFLKTYQEYKAKLINELHKTGQTVSFKK